MTERPKRHVYINENTHVKYGETNEKQGFCPSCGKFSPCPHNALIDQYEAWEKENPRLERLDEEKVKKIIAEVFLNNIKNKLCSQGLYHELTPTKNLAKEICQTFGQPKDAMSVPTVEEINKVLLESPRHKYNYETKEYDTQAKAIHDLITRKLKGQYNEAK